MHHIQKIEEKCEFLPSQDLSLLVSPVTFPFENFLFIFPLKDLKNALIAIENDDSIFRTFEARNYQKLNELFATIMRDKLRVQTNFPIY